MKQTATPKRRKRSMIGFAIIYIVASFLVIWEYNWNRQNITGPETPIEIARECMKPRYNDYWLSLMDMDYAGRNSEYGGVDTYEIGKRHENYTWYYEIILGGTTSGEPGRTVGCKRNFVDSTVEISSNYSGRTERMLNIYGEVKVYNERKGYWETEYFGLEYVDGEYRVVDWFDEGLKTEEEIEKYMQMTIDEIIAITYEDQENLEKFLYKIQEKTLYAVTKRFVIEIVVLTTVFTLGILCLMRHGSGKEKQYE